MTAFRRSSADLSVSNCPHNPLLFAQGLSAWHGTDQECTGCLQVVARPVMNVALTYDHRLIDGREAVTFLKRVKEVVEDPVRLLLDV